MCYLVWLWLQRGSILLLPLCVCWGQVGSSVASVLFMGSVRLTLVSSVMAAHLFTLLLITWDTFEIVAAACGSYKAPEVGSRGEIVILSLNDNFSSRQSLTM